MNPKENPIKVIQLGLWRNTYFNLYGLEVDLNFDVALWFISMQSFRVLCGPVVRNQWQEEQRRISCPIWYRKLMFGNVEWSVILVWIQTFRKLKALCFYETFVRAKRTTKRLHKKNTKLNINPEILKIPWTK